MEFAPAGEKGFAEPAPVLGVFPESAFAGGAGVLAALLAEHGVVGAGTAKPLDDEALARAVRLGAEVGRR